jgi:hypothetical protein
MVLGYPRRLGGRLLVALLIGFGLPFLFGRFDYVLDQYTAWMRHLAADDRQTWPLAGGYRDLRMLFRLWLMPLSAGTFLALQLLVAGIIASVCLVNRARTGSPRAFLTTALVLGCCWMTVFGPATESSTYMLLAPALAWAVLGSSSREPRAIAAFPGLVAIVFALFLTSQVMLWFPGGVWLQNLGTQPLAGLLLFGCLMTAALRSAPAGVPGRLEPNVGPVYDRVA